MTVGQAHEESLTAVFCRPFENKNQQDLVTGLLKVGPNGGEGREKQSRKIQIPDVVTWVIVVVPHRGTGKEEPGAGLGKRQQHVYFGKCEVSGAVRKEGTQERGMA